MAPAASENTGSDSEQCAMSAKKRDLPMPAAAAPYYLLDLIRQQRWSCVVSHVQRHATYELSRELPLHAACWYKAPISVLQALVAVDHGAMIVTDSSGGSSPLHLACRFGAPPNTIRFLIDTLFKARRKHFLHMWMTESATSPLLDLCVRSPQEADPSIVWENAKLLLYAFLVIEKRHPYDYNSSSGHDKDFDTKPTNWAAIFEAIALLGPVSCPLEVLHLAMDHFLVEPEKGEIFPIKLLHTLLGSPPCPHDEADSCNASFLQAFLKLQTDCQEPINERGQWPLHLAVQHEWKGSSLAALMEAFPERVVSTPDPTSGLFPFAAAAAWGDADTCFRLLRAAVNLFRDKIILGGFTTNHFGTESSHR